MATVDLQDTSPLATQASAPVELESSGLTVATTTLPAGLTGVAYNAALGASGGTAPYTWAVTVGSLPAGLTLAPGGGGGGSRGGLFGVTPIVPGEPQATTIETFETLTGREATARKVYFTDSQYPTTAGAGVQTCLDAGLTAYLCYKPAYNPPNGSDRFALQVSLQAFKNMGLKARVILRQEIEDEALTPAQYKAMLVYYEPAVHAVYPGGLAHSSAGWQPALQPSFFPGSLGIVDEYTIDYYANAYAAGKRIDNFAAMAAGTGKPLSVLEMGNTTKSTGPSDAIVTSYLQYVTRVAAANAPGAYLWWEAGGLNHITDPADFRIPLLQALCDTITTGTGGGGSAGAITGTPTGAGVSSFTVQVTDAAAATATAALSITITTAGALTITTTSLPAATTGVPYSQAVAFTGGTAPYSWAVITGALPDGLALDPGAGVISGTPSALAATSGFTVQVTDANSLTASQPLFITVVTGTFPPGPGGPPQHGFPQVIIEAGLDAAAPQVPAGTFILDDPVYGLLGTGKLGDTTIWTDITAYARSGSIIRASTRVQGPLITYQAGTGSVVLKNDTGRFDPLNGTGPYAGALRPMVPFRVRAVYGSVAYALFSGFTDSWGTPGTNWGPNYSETTVTATDGFKALAGTTIPPGQGTGAGDGEDTGARVTRILNAAGWYTDHRRIDTGDSTVQGTLFGDTALNLLQLTADTEIGSLYIDGAGDVVFRHRQAILTDPRSAQVQAVFGDLPGTAHGALTELPYTALDRADDDTQLANDIQATSAGGSLQEAQDLTSQRTYLFSRSYARSDLLLEDDPSTLTWAQWVLSVSLAAVDRFDTVTVTPLRDPGLWPHVLGREIGDLIQVIRRPPGVAAITRNVFIRGITHTVDVSSNTWQTTWDLLDASRYAGFLILDDPVYGLLNTGKLAF